MSSVQKYFSLFKNQLSNSDYPKLLFEEYNNFDLNKNNHINKVLKNNVECTGVVKTNKPLFYEDTLCYYYEFLYSNNSNIDLWNYYYVNIDNLNTIKHLIPYTKQIDFATGSIKNIYLSNKTFYKANLDFPKIELNIYTINVHPILESFKFTGVVKIIKDKLIYEYYNKTETFDSASVNYYSEMPPIGVRNNLFITTNTSIYKQSETAIPEILHLNKNYRNLRFTGQMNNTLLKDKVLYKYIEEINGENFVFYSEAKPYYGDTSLINKALGLDKKISISIPASFQKLKYKQSSFINIKLNKQ